MSVSASDPGSAYGRPLPRWQRWLLPAILGTEDEQLNPDGGSDLPRSPRDWIVDLALFGLAVLGGSGILWSDHRHVSSGLFVVDLVLMVPACLSIWLRRRHPVAIAWSALGLALISDGARGAAVVGLFTVAVRCAPRRSLQMAVLSVADGVSCAFLYPGGGHASVSKMLGWLLFTVAVVCIGLYVRSRRELLLSLRERARRAEGEQQLRVREAQLAERSRIAREMHDVLAHRISLLSVHAGALEFNPGASPEEIAEAAAVIRVSARAAQEELREVIGVLRADAGGEEPLAAPQPTIADVGRLVEESRAAGMEVSLQETIGAESLSPIIGRTVYRVVQEALTNVRKHAPGQVVTVAIEPDGDGDVNVAVVNRPRVGHGGDVTSENGRHPESGLGLVGLAERVTLIGGTLSTESLPGGGFRLLVKLALGEETDD